MPKHCKTVFENGHLNVENDGSKAMINYKATYADKASKNIRINVKYLSTYFLYSSTEPHIIKAECLGKVYIGLINNDVRLLFLVTLSDRTIHKNHRQEKYRGNHQYGYDYPNRKNQNRIHRIFLKRKYRLSLL